MLLASLWSSSNSRTLQRCEHLLFRCVMMSINICVWSLKQEIYSICENMIKVFVSKTVFIRHNPKELISCHFWQAASTRQWVSGNNNILTVKEAHARSIVFAVAGRSLKHLKASINAFGPVRFSNKAFNRLYSGLRTIAKEPFTITTNVRRPKQMICYFKLNWTRPSRCSWNVPVIHIET